MESNNNEKIWSDCWDGKFRWVFPRICPNCSKQYFVPKHVLINGRAKTCSRKCTFSLKIKLLDLKCGWCEAIIYKTPSKLKNSKHGYYFCNRECKERAQTLENGITKIMPSHYGTAKDSYTSAYRKKALRWISQKCQKCSYDKNIKMLDVHHKDGDRMNNKSENLEVLCVWCHALETRNVICYTHPH